MSKDRLRKSYKPLFIVLLLATITAGGVFMFSMLGKSQEERRIESMKLVWSMR